MSMAAKDGNNLTPTSLAEVRFEKRDIEIFNIQDVKTQLETIQNYFFPRLEVVLRYALDLVREAYGVNPYDIMTFIYRPNHRKNAKVNKNYREAHVGISGRRDPKRQLVMRHKDGKPYSFHPTYLTFNVSPKDCSMYVMLQFFVSYIDADFTHYTAKLLEENAESLSSVLNALHISYSGEDGTVTQTLYGRCPCRCRHMLCVSELARMTRA
jgi:hypothetical protein